MRTRLFIYAGLAIATAGRLSAQAVYSFSGTGGSNLTLAVGINDSGYLAANNYSVINRATAGFSNAPGAGVDTLYRGGSSFAYAINNSGRLVGESYSNVSGFTQATYNDSPYSGAPVLLGSLGGSTSAARAVNNSGTIVGYSQVTGNGAYNAFLTTGGALTAGNSLGTFTGGTNSYAYGINSSGQVVGESEGVFTGSHAFVTSGLVSAGTDLGTLGGTNSYARAINTSGLIVGSSQITGNGATHAFAYTTGMTDLGTVGGFTNSYAYSVNDSGLITGYLSNGSGQPHGFVYTNGTMFDLNALQISGLPNGWVIEAAYGINSTGQIAGYVRHSTNTSDSFEYMILTPTGAAFPIPEPATNAVLAGLCALGLAVWRRRLLRPAGAAGMPRRRRAPSATAGFARPVPA